MAGPDVARGGAARPARAQATTALSPLDKWVAPLAALKALELHGETERGLGDRGNARGQRPLSYILFHWSPASLPSAPEKFSKLSAAVHASPGTGGKLRPPATKLLDARRAAGPRRAG